MALCPHRWTNVCRPGRYFPVMDLKRRRAGMPAALRASGLRAHLTGAAPCRSTIKHVLVLNHDTLRGERGGRYGGCTRTRLWRPWRPPSSFLLSIADVLIPFCCCRGAAHPPRRVGRVPGGPAHGHHGPVGRGQVHPPGRAVRLHVSGTIIAPRQTRYRGREDGSRGKARTVCPGGEEASILPSAFASDERVGPRRGPSSPRPARRRAWAYLAATPARLAAVSISSCRR